MVVIFDDFHGQKNWAEATDNPQRQDSGWASFANQLRKYEIDYAFNDTRLDKDILKNSAGLIIRPPTGHLNLETSEWELAEETHFTPSEIDSILSYIRAGGCLFAFGYRFGDIFTKSNLNSLFSPLGCILNNDAVIDLNSVGKMHPINTKFETIPNDFLQSWASEKVSSVYWRPVSTFTILSNYIAEPVIQSTDTCIRMNLPQMNVSYEQAPICVSGKYGQGKFVLIGGPHAFKTSQIGFFNNPDNYQLSLNIINWLFLDRKSKENIEAFNPSVEESQNETNIKLSRAKPEILWQKVCNSKKEKDKGESLVDFVEYMFTNMPELNLLSRSKWSIKRDSELDLVFRCDSSKPLWLSSHGIVPVECKNWKNPVGATEISRFADKVDRTSSKMGIFVSRKFTKQALNTVNITRIRRNIIIGIISDSEIHQYLDGNTPSSKILESCIIRSMLL